MVLVVAAEMRATEAGASTAEVGSDPGPGHIVIWSVDFPAGDLDDPDRLAPRVTASVRLDDQDGAVVHAKAARAIDYQSGAISRGARVEVRYESPEDDAPGDPVWVFDLVDVKDSPVGDGDE